MQDALGEFIAQADNLADSMQLHLVADIDSGLFGSETTVSAIDDTVGAFIDSGLFGPESTDKEVETTIVNYIDSGLFEPEEESKKRETKDEEEEEDKKKGGGGLSPVVVKPEPIQPVVIVPETPASLIDAVKAIPGMLFDIGKSAAVLGKIGDLTDLMHSPDANIKQLADLISSKGNIPLSESDNAIVAGAGVVGALIGAPFGFLPSIMDCYQPGLGQSLGNMSRALWTPGRLGMTELAVSWVRNNIDDAKLYHDGHQNGFSDEDITEYIKLARQMLSVNDLTTLWLRGELDDLNFKNRMAELGVTGDDTEHIKKLAYFIPGVNDLIHMAVREAFTPDIATQFGQYEDYPQALTEWAMKQGLSEEWAMRYWAAHWELPSVNMGFEMYHRKIIGLDTLKTLLRALDVMPYWRDKLIELAYQPITRVDIRRIHKLMGKSDEWLQERYEAVGYSPQDAAELVQFTIELNKEEAKIEKQADRDLTASEITGAYANAMISQADASGLLSGLDYDQAEIDLKLAIADLVNIKRVMGKKIDIIKQRLMYGYIDLNGAVDALNKLDLPPYEMEYQLADIQLDLELAQFKTEAATAKTQAAKAKK